MTKKNNPLKKLVPAAGMLMVSAMMLASSTYAWFTMNDTVSVNGIKLKATAEDGLVISDYQKSSWKAAWDVTMDAAVLSPTSAAAVASPTFVRAGSRDFDDADAEQAVANYTDLTLTYSNAPTTGEGIGGMTRTVNGTSLTSNYVLLRKFYIKGTSSEAWANQNLVIDQVTATAVGENAAFVKLDNSLRVLVVVGTDAFIYAPVQNQGGTNENPAATTMSYKWKNTTTVAALAPDADSVCTSITSIPASTTNAPIEVSMYVYFEGEDANCKSSNISGITLNDISVSAQFKTQAVATP